MIKKFKKKKFKTKKFKTKKNKTKKYKTKKYKTKKGGQLYSINKELSIKPTGTESQYEAFQSIFAYIMAGDIDPPSAYKLLCLSSNIQLTNNKPIDRTTRNKKSVTNMISNKLIYYDNTKTTTHYIGYLNDEERNPYNYYQANGTQGFCQMFAYFLVMNDIHGFQIVDQSKKIDINNFNKLAINTQLCAEKAIKLLITNKDIYTRFEEQFNEIMMNKRLSLEDDHNDNRRYYGINPGTTCDKYIKDFIIINSDINNIKNYIVDQPLNKWNNSKPKQKLLYYYKI